MAELPWQLILATVGAVATAIGSAAKWVFDRFDKHQKAYLDELRKRDEREEERRKQHLEDTRLYAQSLRDLAHQLRTDSRRPPPEVKS